MSVIKKILVLLFLTAGSVAAQGFPYRDIILSGAGRPIGNANVELCAPVATTAAQVISNTAVLTFGSNPITAGFVSGASLTVAGFTGGDTYYNGTFPILSVTSSTITYSLTHANASASSNGSALQEGNATTGCAGLVSIYSNQALTSPLTQPIQTDGLGNFSFYASPIATAYIQVYGASVVTQFYPAAIPCVPNTACITTFPAPTIASGFGTGASIPHNNGTTVFTVNVGTSNTGTGVLTMPAAPNGWDCSATDVTTISANVFLTRVVPTTTTSVTFQNYSDAAATHTWVDSDVLSVRCNAY